MTRLTTEAQLENFAVEAHGKILTISFVRWLEDDRSLRVYVRRSTRFINDRWITMIDLANIAAEPQGTGRFTRFLEYAEHLQAFEGVYIESIQDKRFAKFFARRGYTRNSTSDPYQIDFYKLWNKESR